MIAIIGGGLAGLACAKDLVAAGYEACILESSQRVGGRVATDPLGGYLVDRGFQVLLDSYSELRPYLPALRPRYFDSGAILWDQGKKWTLRNPLFHPFSAISSGLAGAFSLSDKLAVTRLAMDTLTRSDVAWLTEAAQAGDTSMLDSLRGLGVSPTAIERFFRPFFGGVFLDDSLSASASLFKYYLKKFAIGRAFLPEGGAGRFPEILADSLPEGVVQTGCRVEGWELAAGRVTALRIQGSGRLPVEYVILAMGPAETARFLGGEAPPMTTVATLTLGGATSLYPEKLLVLPAGRRRLVRHLVQISNICPALAPAGRHMIVATLINGCESPDAIPRARAEIAEIFPAASDMEIVDFRITREATLFSAPGSLRRPQDFHLPPNTALAGDLAGWSCVESSLASGRRAARRAFSQICGHKMI
ncbi:MAG: NAD(P)/FAD-dependent oxidoreductase [Terrimicrobiaceae bacterium]